MLPLPFAGEPHLIAQPGAQPLTKGYRVVPGNIGGRMIIQWSMLGYGAFVTMSKPLPPIRVSIAVGRLHEGTVLHTRDRIFCNLERLDVKRAGAPFQADAAARDIAPDDIRQPIRAQMDPPAAITSPR